MTIVTVVVIVLAVTVVTGRGSADEGGRKVRAMARVSSRLRDEGECDCEHGSTR